MSLHTNANKLADSFRLFHLIGLSAIVLSLVFFGGCLTAHTSETGSSQSDAEPLVTEAPVHAASSSDTYPVVQLPEDADPDDENWAGVDLRPKPPVLPKTPDQEIHHLIPPQGYDLETVLSEPAIEQPGAIAFDGNGRMFVLELRSYMLDADASNEQEPISMGRHARRRRQGVVSGRCKRCAFVLSIPDPLRKY